MKILVLSFYFKPDLCAGSFRTTALVEALLDRLPEDVQIEVITTLPNRYHDFSSKALEVETLNPRLIIRRLKLPKHHSGMFDQAKAFVVYAYGVMKWFQRGECVLVYGTSSRLMTAVLSAYIAGKEKVPLYLDIRDIFVDTIGDVLPNKFTAIVKPIFSMLERWAVRRASKVNLVSYGFKDYFMQRYPEQRYSYFTNGVDGGFSGGSCHAKMQKNNDVDEQLVTVLYAGNIGEGQGLHVIIPELAKRLEGKVRFRLIGDGGRKNQLLNRLEILNCENVEVLPPVKRDLLIKEYCNADVLFLHLNDYPAFKKVLPSKIFEYAAVGKPVWAGLAGYSATFVKKEIDNAVVFSPCDVESAVCAYATLDLKEVDRSSFVEKYSRARIVRDMSADVMSVISPALLQGKAQDG